MKMGKLTGPYDKRDGKRPPNSLNNHEQRRLGIYNIGSRRTRSRKGRGRPKPKKE